MIPQPLLWFLIVFMGVLFLCAFTIWVCAYVGDDREDEEPTEMDYDPSSLGKED